jgi:hypothetical protein
MDRYKEDLERFKDDETYYADKKYVTNSMLTTLDRSPKHLANYLKYGSGTSPALEFGRAFHLAILEPEVFEQEVVGFNGARRGGEWKEFKEEHKDKLIMNLTEATTLKRMRDTIMSNSIARPLIEECQKEVAMIWKDKDTGIECKGKADGVGDYFMLDLKTTREPNFESFKRSAYKYGYHRQSAYYLDGFNNGMKKDMQEFWFICIEKSSPHNLGIYQCSDEFLQQGREEYKVLLERYKEKFQGGIEDSLSSFSTGIL